MHGFQGGPQVRAVPRIDADHGSLACRDVLAELPPGPIEGAPAAV
jgi:hypothetical protein